MAAFFGQSGPRMWNGLLRLAAENQQTGGGHCFFPHTGMEVIRTDKTIGLRKQTAVPVAPGPGVVGTGERKNDQTGEALMATKAPALQGPVRKSVPLFGDILFKAREFDPL